MSQLGILLSRNVLVSNQEPSSPEDDSGSSFHTPHHIPVPSGGSSLSFIASQDSIDIFLDAYSTLNLQRKVPLQHSIQQHSHHQSHMSGRRRHASSGAKFEDYKQKNIVEENLEDNCTESSCMLPKGPVARVRHSSYGKGSRSCNGSPLHSMNSSRNTNSPLHSMFVTNYVPCVEGEVREGTDVKAAGDEHLCDPEFLKIPEVFIDERLPKNGSTQTPADGCDNLWANNYVPYADHESLLLTDCTNTAEGSGRQRKPLACVLIPGVKYGKKQKERPGWRQRVKEEFNKSNFKLEHKSPHLFVTSQWQRPNRMCCLYLGYRIFWAAYFCLWCIWSLVTFKGLDASFKVKMHYWIYLTIWGFWMLTIDTVLQAVNCVLHMKKVSSEGDARYSSMLPRLKVSWLFSNITSTVHIIITALFWIFVSGVSEHPFSPVSINVHIVQCIYVILDLCVSATPRRVLHAYMPMCYLLTYGTFTGFYYLGGGMSAKGLVALYPILDWSKPLKTLPICSFVLLVVTPLSHLWVYFAYWIRMKVWRHIRNRDSMDKGTLPLRTKEERV